MTARRLIIEGRVQGVGYRWWAVVEARALDLRGWVRNRRNGSVELLAIGDADALDRLADLCAEGPSGARVERVIVNEAEDDGGAAGFDQRPTA
jgi:acylphosphatase